MSLLTLAVPSVTSEVDLDNATLLNPTLTGNTSIGENSGDVTNIGSAGSTTVLTNVTLNGVTYTGATNLTGATLTDTTLTGTTGLGNAAGDVTVIGGPGASVTFPVDITVSTINVGRGNNLVVSNTSIGNGALFSNTTGSLNTAVGNTALNANSIGDANTAVGKGSMVANTAGANNTSVGYSSISANLEGVYNTAIGDNALSSNVYGNYNVAIGSYALANAGIGINISSFNVAIGADAGTGVSTGSGNVCIGNASDVATATSNTIVIGANVSFAPSNGINIGNVIYCENTNTTDVYNMALGTSPGGYVLDNTCNLRVHGPDGAKGVAFVTLNVDPFIEASKPEYAKVDSATKEGASTLGKLNVVPHVHPNGRVMAGVTFESLRETLPELVHLHPSDESQHGCNMIGLIPYLVSALQQANARIDALERLGVAK